MTKRSPGAQRQLETAVAAVPVVVATTTLGELADQLYQLRADRLALQHQVDDIKSTETKLTDEVIRLLGDAHATAVAGRVARAGITPSRVGAIKDFAAVKAYVVATGDLELFQRRLNDGYLRDRWDAGEAVPGIEPFTVIKLSLTKV